MDMASNAMSTPRILPAISPHLVPEIVDKWADITPGAIALSDEHTRMTYGDLNRCSNQFAQYLSTLGVKADSLVALCLGRSVAQIWSALAVLKAGGAYVPLDPSYPVDRISFMVRDAEPCVLITNRAMVEHLPAGPWRTVVVDRDLREIERQPMHAPSCCVTGENLAYVIYTSGSTGTPKGVEITHRSLLNLVSWHQRNFAVTARDRATSLSSVGFDAAVWEVWPHLAVGASVHVPADALRYQPVALRDWLVEMGITISFVPTLLAERLITLSWPAHTALRALLTGADVLHHYPSQTLPFTFFNNYGPTECTVVATSAPVSTVERPDLVPPIGWPIDNTQVYILDEHLQPVTAGSAGELYISGNSVARGYRNNPQLTADKFLADPFSTIAGARMYRTGDLGRSLPDGQIAFLGRIDDQVKIRGYRIELNEIVAALDHHPSIQMSFVLARENSSGQKQLVAYVVPRSGSKPSGEDLGKFLVSQLPDYMVPEVFVFVPSLPLNANGKVERSALPMPQEVGSETGTDTAPRVMIEERLRDILQTLLGISTVAVDDNFFMLGGNSLLGTQLISRMRDAFGVEVSLLVLFDHSTIAGLAVQIEKLILEKLDAGQRDSA
jgi:amino acid adenylation domain-containing protein